MVDVLPVSAQKPAVHVPVQVLALSPVAEPK